MKRIFFFATKSDIAAVTEAVEEQSPLTYILAYHSLFPEYGLAAPQYGSALQIPRLGMATRRQTSNCERYIVVNRSTHVEPITRVVGGKDRTGYEPGNSSDSVEFNAGGFWEGSVLINGLVHTWSDSAVSQQLMRRFSSAMKKSLFRKINAYWIGPEAFRFLENGGRLTLNVDAASSFDIKIPQ